MVTESNVAVSESFSMLLWELVPHSRLTGGTPQYLGSPTLPLLEAGTMQETRKSNPLRSFEVLRKQEYLMDVLVPE